MDFYTILERKSKPKGEETETLTIYPNFRVCRSKDLMIRGGDFYAVWDKRNQQWSTDEYDIIDLVDGELRRYGAERKETFEGDVTVSTLSSYQSGHWNKFQSYVKSLSDNSQPLDRSVVFANTEKSRDLFSSHALSYSLEPGSVEGYDRVMSTLYGEEERRKIEWAIGSVIAGDSKKIQKFLVFYGDPGTGKSTVLNIVAKLFEGYTATFEAAALGSASAQFATAAFKTNPLVAIEHDGDLSRLERNTLLNSIVSHEPVVINEKFKTEYTLTVDSLLMIGTNLPVKITDAKSGLIRRLIDVHPTGEKLSPSDYQDAMHKIGFELGAIAQHCLDVYRSMGRNYYNQYIPKLMMRETNLIYNFVEEYIEQLSASEGITLKRAWTLYQEWVAEANIPYPVSKYRFRDQLEPYFEEYLDQKRINGERFKNLFLGFKHEKLESGEPVIEQHERSLILDSTESLLDRELADCPAQYASDKGTPLVRWDDCETSLSAIDTSKLHYVRPPANHIVIDFDLKGDDGEKSMEANLEAASKWPSTYAEFSKGGAGIHLHYIYDGDVDKLAAIYDEGIEVKVFHGKSSLRRRLSYCNTTPIAHISSGLPERKPKKVLNKDYVQTEKSLREAVEKNLRKEVHGATKPSVDFIEKILSDAYSSGIPYDLSDMKTRVLTFAMQSTNQSAACIKAVGRMKFKSEGELENTESYSNDPLVFFDVEVFPNLFLVNWKFRGTDQVYRMINPKPQEIESLCQYKLVGFNNRKYDNHILYAAYMGYSNEQLFNLSQRIIEEGVLKHGFTEAYNLSYTDVYDFSSKKQSLKKFEVELGIHHQELGLPWDQPVPEERWVEVATYCDNDVLATEAVFEARHADFVARQILAELSGLTVNDSTNKHSGRIIFGKDREPQKLFNYTDLSEMFPGYKYEFGKSIYRGEEVGEGGYVYSEPGIHENVALLDVASMHPTSIEQLDLFGPYTENFSGIKAARIAIKHRDFVTARTMLDGKLAPYLSDENEADTLAYALKIVINSVYGLTAAKFPNLFRDPRNVDNIVAKRGALFMVDLKHFVQEQGFTVAHIKTDSIKIPNATPEIIEKVMEFGKKYGYDFEHEATYDRMCLVNDAVYIAKYEGEGGHWTATGAQFQHPYVFKTMFSREPVVFEDLIETKQVKTAIYLDMNEDLNEDEHNYQFVGRLGAFVPVKPGEGGGILLRQNGEKFAAVTGTSGFRWLEAEFIAGTEAEDTVDMTYYRQLVDAAIDQINKYGDYEGFVS